VETFTSPREFVDNNRYSQDRKKNIAALDLSSIDEPIADIVSQFIHLPHCFTLQCCYGHFLRHPKQDIHSIDPVPPGYCGTIRYRIAYIALCIDNSARGRSLRHSMEQISDIDPGYVQFGSADWFWERWVNSYALQVEPERYKTYDQISLEHLEALHIQQIRGRFFQELRELLARELAVTAGE
jgi:hypothetical protein